MNSQAKGHLPESLQSEKATNISELCTQQVWMMLGERSLLHNGSNWNLFDVG